MPADTRPTGRWIAVLSLAVCVALLVLIHLYNPLAAGLWLETFFNSLHVPVFAVIALGVFVALRFSTKFRFDRCVLVAMGLTMLLGVLSEIAQIPGPRDASLEDLVADWLGSISALLLVFAAGREDSRNRRVRAIWAIAGIALMFLALKPLILVSAAYVERNRNVPMLFSSDASFSKTFLRLQNATLEVNDRPIETRTIGKVTLEDGPWPGLVFHDLWPDWSEYSFLAIELGMDDTAPLEIHIRVHDRIHSLGNQPYDDRFNMTYTLDTGSQVIRVPLDEIRDAPRNRQMDLSRIHGVVIFATRAEAGRSFEIMEIRLE